MARARYSAERQNDIVELRDLDSRTAVRVAPGFGNRAVAMTVNGENILWHRDDGGLNGIPFLAPWGNRLTGGFHVKGRWHALNGARLHRDASGLPIHGLLTDSG